MQGLTGICFRLPALKKFRAVKKWPRENSAIETEVSKKVEYHRNHIEPMRIYSRERDTLAFSRG